MLLLLQAALPHPLRNRSNSSNCGVYGNARAVEAKIKVVIVVPVAEKFKYNCTFKDVVVIVSLTRLLLLH